MGVQDKQAEAYLAAIGQLGAKLGSAIAPSFSSELA
jgi:hypothetical protein